MNRRHLEILHTFLPDRIHHNRRIAERTGRDSYDVSNSTSYLLRTGYLTQVILPSKAKGKLNRRGRPITRYYRLTDKGRQVAESYARAREASGVRIAELITAGMSPAQAAVKIATETDNSTR